MSKRVMYLLIAVFAVSASMFGAGYNDMKCRDPHLENTTDADTYLRRKFREDVTDRTTGIGLRELKTEAERIVVAEKDRLPWCVVKAHKTSIRTRFQ